MSDDSAGPTRLPLAPADGAARPPLSERLAARVAPAELVEPDGDRLRCVACAHRCSLSEGKVGACGVRFVRDGALRAPFGYVARRNARAVETNTVFHVRPGALSLTFGMYGCDLRCPYCHNWRTSQALREGVEAEHPVDVTAAALVDEAVAAGCEVLCSAYNEPMITAEWARSVFSEARARGLATALISDGHTTREALAYLRPVTDVFRVDLKAFDERGYRALGGSLAPVLDAIIEARALGYWVEVVTLVVPGFNDDLGALREAARALAAVDPSMPWHLNAYQPRYKLAGTTPRAPAITMVSAAGMAYAQGLSFVYVGNVGAEARELGHTRCPRCLATVVERDDYRAVFVASPRGECPGCGERVPGVWR